MAPNVTVLIEDTSRGISRTAVSDETGRYSFLANPARKIPSDDESGRICRRGGGEPGIAGQLARNGEHFAYRVKEVTETVTVSAEAIQVNTTDASLGNAIGTKEVLQVPLYLRNVVGLLAFQPGVTSFNDSNTDDRNGSVNGGRGDQTNITLDGIDVNDHHQRRAFTSVVRLSLD